MKINTTLHAEISADYTPERPAPFCQNPSSPLYAIPPQESVMESVCVELMGFDITDTIMCYEPELYDRIVDRLYDEGERE